MVRLLIVYMANKHAITAQIDPNTQDQSKHHSTPSQYSNKPKKIMQRLENLRAKEFLNSSNQCSLDSAFRMEDSHQANHAYKGIVKPE